jgi:hypothetical protein
MTAILKIAWHCLASSDPGTLKINPWVVDQRFRIRAFPPCCFTTNRISFMTRSIEPVPADQPLPHRKVLRMRIEDTHRVEGEFVVEHR